MISPLKALSVCALAISAIVASTPTAVAVSGFNTTFDPYTPNLPLSGQDGWTTNDPSQPLSPNTTSYVGESNYVGNIPGYGVGSDYWGKIGGGLTSNGAPIIPGMVTSDVGHGVNLTGATAFAFSVQFALTSSLAATDTFGWAITMGGTNYATLLFTPNAPNQFNVSLSSSLGTTTTNYAVIYNSPYFLDISIDKSGNLTTWIDGGEVGLTNIHVSNSAPETITAVSATWTVANPGYNPNNSATTVNDNALIFNNFNVVPEPSTVGLSIIAGLGMCGIMLRRRAKAA